MELVLTTTSSLPWDTRTTAGGALRHAMDQFAAGSISSADLEKSQRQVIKEVIVEQVKAGIEICTDGQIRWSDPVSHLASRLEGVELGPALPFLDTDTTYRQPVITGPIKYRSALLRDEFSYARSFVSPKSMKPVFTGPYTLAKLSQWQGGPYKTLQEVTLAYAQALAAEIEELFSVGAEMLQVDEPALPHYPSDFDIFAAGLLLLAQSKEWLTLGLYVYGGDVTPLYDRLQGLPVDLLGLDFTRSPGLIDRIEAAGSDKPLGLGLIDARSASLEDSRQLLPILERVVPRIKGETARLNPSAGLRDLPRDIAFKKLALMRDVKRYFLLGDESETQ
jgi:5-methyltetrahydropteroyltriglutamate--homocysteine methyltransferase